MNNFIKERNEALLSLNKKKNRSLYEKIWNNNSK